MTHMSIWHIFVHPSIDNYFEKLNLMIRKWAFGHLGKRRQPSWHFMDFMGDAWRNFACLVTFAFFCSRTLDLELLTKSSNAWMAAFHWDFQVMADVFVFLPTPLDNSSTIMIKPAGFSLTSFLQISRHFLGSWVCEILRPSSTETLRSDFAACSLILYWS